MSEVAVKRGRLLRELREERAMPSAKTARAIRIAAGVSQLRMARELGVARQSLVRWESGTEPMPGNRKRWARLLRGLQEVSR